MVRTSAWIPFSQLCFDLNGISGVVPDEIDLKASFAGVDESNHGRDPEIYVAVYSDKTEDIAPSYRFSRNSRMIRGVLEKKNGRFHISDCHGISFLYIIVTQEHKEFLRRHRLKADKDIRVAALSAFAKAFHKLDMFLVDGNFGGDVLDKIRQLVPPHLFPKRIGAMPSADTIYPLVNTAHHVAYALHNYYNEPINLNTKYIFPERQIGFCLEELLKI